MKIYTYCSNGGKDLIREFFDSLPLRESVEGYYILEHLELEGCEFLKTLTTRQIEGKLWEIKYPRHNRIFYAMLHDDAIYLLHACMKQKSKAERFEVEKAKKRMKDAL
jgi:phage-related protein